eukprot:m.208992 g.208992  ORF g.208992 m.208992 type:complete len:568 (+) comp25436_c0_seq1:84-1787(+)
MMLASTLVTLVAMLSEPSPTPTVVDNTAPRTDEHGDTVNAHQGHITRFQQPDGSWRFYWVGSAWVRCTPGANSSTCVDGQPATPDGECLEPKENGCLSMKYGACGFNNNNISVYSSASLGNSGWRLESYDAVPMATRAIGEYWQPNFEFNPTTGNFVMWWIYSGPNTTIGVVQSATAAHPGGPYTIASHNVSLRYKSFTSANIAVDRPYNVAGSAVPGTDAYVMYSSFSANGPKAVVEKLNAAWTDTVVPARASAQFGSGEGGVLFRVDTPAGKTVYYALVGKGCCFCPTGVPLQAWRADSPVGPWALARTASINLPYTSPPLATGQLQTQSGGGSNVCVTASTAPSCRPNGTLVPNAGVDGVCDLTLTACSTTSAAQQWQLLPTGEIQSGLAATTDPSHAMCLDASHGIPGRRVYTNFCVGSVGQKWKWGTSGKVTQLELVSSATCVASAGTMAACSSTQTVWRLPPSSPLPPAPSKDCHGCQVGSCCVPRVWELPTQQQGVTPMLQQLAAPPPECGGGFVMWSGDAWQQAPDDRKQHDPQWWVPLCFNVDGTIGNLTGTTQWRLK